MSEQGAEDVRRMFRVCVTSPRCESELGLDRNCCEWDSCLESMLDRIGQAEGPFIWAWVMSVMACDIPVLRAPSDVQLCKHSGVNPKYKVAEAMRKWFPKRRQW